MIRSQKFIFRNSLLIILIIFIAIVVGQAQYSTYYVQKKTLFEQLPNTKNEIVFLGDSITDGCEWSEMFDNDRIRNRGISGDVTQGVLDRIEEVTESQPHKVFLMIGVNDLAEGRTSDYVVKTILDIVEAIQQQSPKTIVYVQSILPVNDHYGKFKGHTSKGDKILAVNRVLMGGVNGQYHYLDLHSKFLDKEGKLDNSFSNDGLHLTGEGYLRWADIIKPLID